MDEIIQKASAYGTQVSYIRADFRNKNEVENVGLKALEKYNAIDILINNAGTIGSRLVLDESIEQLEQIMQVNAFAPFQLIKILCPKMVERKWGRVINVSSIAALAYEPAVLAYSMSKTAIIPLTKTLANELGQTGVTANAIIPGLVNTPMFESGIQNFGKQTGLDKEKALEYFLAKSKTKKVIDPKDVAALASFLASNEARSITGSLQVIDGGHLI